MAATSPAAYTPADGNYVWAIGSEPTRASAERLLQRFATDDLPGEVFAANVNGQTWYRVTLGRFRTRAEAQAARGRLPSGVPSDSYVRTIR